MSEFSEIAQVVAPFLSGALGIGLSYGALKNSIKNLKEQVLDNKVKLNTQVGEARCKMMRDECRQNLCYDLKEIKEEIKDHRKKFEEFAKFVGRLEESNTKL